MQKQENQVCRFAKIACAIAVTAVGIALIPSLVKKTQASLTKADSTVSEETLSSMGPEIVKTTTNEEEQ